ncbi:MAG: hypothetical protein R6V67_07535 [Spirochaetia bacterium]
MSTMQEVFSWKRLFLCLKRDVKPNSRSIYVVFGALTGVLLIMSAADLFLGEGSPDYHREIFNSILFIGGFIFASGVFKEIHNKESNQAYLMLPASAVEKVLSRLLIVSAGWVLFTILWFTAFAALSEGLNSLIFGRSHELFTPFSAWVWKQAAHYTVVQSVFLLGAIYFRKLHFFKTVLTGAACALVFSLLAGILVRLVFADYFTTTLIIGNGEGISLISEELTAVFTGVSVRLAPLKDFFYWVVFPLFCWTLVYIRFREVQVKDGV